MLRKISILMALKADRINIRFMKSITCCQQIAATSLSLTSRGLEVRVVLLTETSIRSISLLNWLPTAVLDK